MTPTEPRLVGPHVIAAPGRIEGRTENIDLRPRLTEQIAAIAISEGDWVQRGDILVRLDAARYDADRALAEAELKQAQSRLDRLVNGPRTSEIDRVRAAYEGALAEFEGAERAFTRVQRLGEGQAASPQMLDDHVTRLKSAAAALEASEARLATIEAPPREDELAGARAAIEAAKSRLRRAEVYLSRTELRAPISGRVLEVNGDVGELTRPDQPQPLVTLADTSRLRVRAEIDEYDAMRVGPGQSATVRADSLLETRLTGTVIKIDPKVHRKRLFEDRPGERLDSYLRDTWIELDDAPDLPIGLPVDVFIRAGESAETTESAESVRGSEKSG